MCTRFHQVLLAAICGTWVTGCEPPPRVPVLTAPPEVTLPATVLELTPDEAANLMTQVSDLQILDVRTEGEAQKEGRLPGAKLYDYLHGEDAMRAIGEPPKDKMYLVYCAVGGRAKLTAARMSEMGFNKLSILKGGLNEWIAAGKAVEK